MDNPIQVDLGRIAQDLQIRRVQVESVVQLSGRGEHGSRSSRATARKRTGNLNEVVIHEIQLRVQRLRELAERKETILKAIEAQGKLIPDLAAAIRAAENPKRLEDLYLPFKPKKRTKASDARDRGLEPLAFRVWTRDEALTDLAAAAQEFVDPEKGVESVEKVLEGVGHILAEAISEMAAVRDAVRKVVWKTGKIVTTKGEIPEGQGLEYRDYFDYSEPVAQIPPHRILAINRGDKEGPLKVRLDVPRPELEAVLFSQLPLEGHPQAELFRAAAIDALDRLILPSMEREVRRDLTEAAEKHAVEVFAKQPAQPAACSRRFPSRSCWPSIPGSGPAARWPCSTRAASLLDHGVIYPHPPQNRRSEAKVFLKDLVGKHKVGVVAIGNGTACRETEELIAEIIAEGIQFSQGGARRRAAGGNGTHSPEPSDSLAPPSDSPASSVPDAAAVTTPAQDHAAADTDQADAAGDSGEGNAETAPAQSQAPVVEPDLAQVHDERAATGFAEPSHADGTVSSISGRRARAGRRGIRRRGRIELVRGCGAGIELPPISGGAPDSTSNETDMDSSPGLVAT